MERFTLLAIAITIAGLFALLTIKVGWNTRSPVYQRRIELGIIIALALISVVARLTWIPHFRGVSGGDPYNYLFITQQLSRLENPFEATKRLPGYPLVLLPTYLSPAIDDIVYMRTVSVMSAGATLILVALLARSIRLPWSVQLAAPLILSMQKDFWWISLRPEPYTFYTALLLTALVLFFHLDKRWAQVAFGSALGMAAMTRQEGFVLAVVLTSAAVIAYRSKLWWAGYARAFVPALLLVMPFFAHNTLEYGNPLYTPYFEGERLQIVDSWEAFKDNLGATWGILGTMWRPMWESLYRIPFTDPLFALSATLAIAYWATIRHSIHANRQWGKPIALAGTCIVFLAAAWLATTALKQFAHLAMTVTAGIMFVSIFPFLATTTWRGSTVVLVLISQLLIATWFHPFPKHYQQSYPLLILMFATALFTLFNLFTDPKASRATRMQTAITAFFYYWAVATPLVFIFLILASQRNALIDKYNQDTAFDHVVYEAVQVAQRFPGPYGTDQRYLPAQLYFEDRAEYFREDEHAPRAKQRAWLAEHRIRTFIVTNTSPTLFEPETNWQRVFFKKAEDNDERIIESTVYLLP